MKSCLLEVIPIDIHNKRFYVGLTVILTKSQLLSSILCKIYENGDM